MRIAQNDFERGFIYAQEQLDWLAENRPHCPILLVLSKTDLNPDDYPNVALGKLIRVAKKYQCGLIGLSNRWRETPYYNQDLLLRWVLMQTTRMIVVSEKEKTRSCIIS